MQLGLDAAFWLVLAVLALGLEVTGLAGWHGFRPLTSIVRGEMRRSSVAAGAVAAFLLWLAYHFLVQTYL